jgi:hypothetical protein
MNGNAVLRHLLADRMRAIRRRSDRYRAEFVWLRSGTQRRSGGQIVDRLGVIVTERSYAGIILHQYRDRKMPPKSSVPPADSGPVSAELGHPSVRVGESPALNSGERVPQRHRDLAGFAFADGEFTVAVLHL